MTREEYIKYSMDNGNMLKINWYYTFFTLLEDTENEYFVYKDKRFYVKVDKGEEELVDFIGYPVYTFKFPVKLSRGDMKNLRTNVDTTVGRIVANKTLLEYNFGDKLEYINKKFSISDIEKELAKRLKDKSISTHEYLRFTDATIFLTGLTSITNVSATFKNILPPPNIDKIKKDLIDQYNKKYGPKWVNDRLRVVEYVEELKKVDAEWLKDDPTNNRLIGKKIKDNARVKSYLTFGPEVGFTKDGSEMTFVQNSLSDQYPKDKKQITAIYNSIRSGSYDRGQETQKGGVAAKDILRALSNYVIAGEDCGSKIGKTVLVTESNIESLKNRYMIQGGKTVLIEDPKKYLGKTIELRSPMYCKNKESTYCKKCVGALMSDFKSAISLIGTDVSNILLTISMKSMHSNVVTLHKLDLKEIIK